MEPALLIVSMLLPWTGFIAGIVTGRWWAIPLTAAAWIAIVLAAHDERLTPSLVLDILPIAGGTAAVGVALHWLLFRPEALMAGARAGGGRLRSWMRAIAATRRG